jgi:hypothetical protein
MNGHRPPRERVLYRPGPMRLDWMTRPMRPLSVDELVARGRHAEAAARFRAELDGRSPTLADRVRLADLLVHADRGGEALPILLGVADEQARYGFRDKALEALRRADAIAPGDPATRERFLALAQATEAPKIAGKKRKLAGTRTHD